MAGRGRGAATEAGLSYQLDAHVAHEKWPALWSCCRAAVACHVSQCLSVCLSICRPALAAERALNYVHLYSFFYCRGLIPNYCANYFKFFPQLSPVMDNVNFGNSPRACVCVCVACVCAIKVLHVPQAETCPLAASHRHTYTHTHAEHLKLFNKRHNLLKVFT